MRRIWIITLSLLFLLSCNMESKQKSEPDNTNNKKEEVGKTEPIKEEPAENAEEEKVNPLQALNPETKQASHQPPPGSRKLYDEAVRLLKSKDYDKAIEKLNEYIQLAPDNSHAYYNRGLGYYELKMYNEATMDFSRAYKLNPRDSTSLLYMGMIRYFQEDYRGAIDEYSQSIEIGKYYSTAYYNRGIAYGQLKLFESALADFDKALEINPNYREAYFNRGLAKFFVRDTIGACTDWQEAKILGSSKAGEAINIYCKGSM